MVRAVKNPNEKLSQHFTAWEFMCPCCGLIFVDYELIDILEDLRKEIKRPVIITSGYRCEKHNKEIGGAPNSYHTKGMACDITTTQGITVKEIFLILENILEERRQGLGGLIIYTSEGFNHVDTRQARMRGYRIHPKQKVQPLTKEMRKVLFRNTKEVAK